MVLATEDQCAKLFANLRRFTAGLVPQRIESVGVKSLAISKDDAAFLR